MTKIEITPFPLRMPAPLRTTLEARAKQNGRSANSEIIAMLTAMVEAHSPALAAVPAPVLLDELITRYGAQLQVVIAQDVAEQAGLATPRRSAKPKV